MRKKISTKKHSINWPKVDCLFLLAKKSDALIYSTLLHYILVRSSQLKSPNNFLNENRFSRKYFQRNSKIILRIIHSKICSLKKVVNDFSFARLDNNVEAIVDKFAFTFLEVRHTLSLVWQTSLEAGVRGHGDQFQLNSPASVVHHMCHMKLHKSIDDLMYFGFVIPLGRTGFAPPPRPCSVQVFRTGPFVERWAFRFF